MKRILWVVLISVSSLVVVLVLLGLGLAVGRSLTAEKVGWDAPLSRADAVQAIDRIQIEYPLVQSARDIWVCERREGTQQNFLYVRLVVDPTQVDQQIHEATQAYRFAFPQDAPQRISIPSSSLPSAPWFLAPRWWRPSQIKHGYVVTFGRGFGPVFWFDSDHNILYHYEVA